MIRLPHLTRKQLSHPSTKFDPIRKLLQLVMMFGTAFLFVVAGYAMALGDEIAIWALVFGWLNLWLVRRER